MTTAKPFEDMTSYLLERMTGLDLVDLLCQTLTELQRRGAELQCGNPECRPAYGAQSLLDTAWASVHHHDDGVFRPVFYSEEAVEDAVCADREMGGSE